MTIASSNSRNDYVASGGNCVFQYTFKISDATAISVHLCGVEITSGFTVSGAGNDAGGSVTISNVVSGSCVALVRNEPYTQTLDLQEHGAVSLEAIEDAFDHGVMLDQQLREITDRALTFEESSSLMGVTVDDLTGQAGKVLAVNADEQSLGWVDQNCSTSAATGTFTATGGVARTISSKLGDVISVMDFGAVGNGVADDTTAVQNAMDSGAAGLLFPAAKTFSLGTLTVPTTLKLMTGGGTLVQKAANSNLLNATSVNDLLIDGLTFTGVAGSGLVASNVAINAATCARLRIRDCTFTQWQHHAIFLKGCVDSVVRGNVIYACSSGIHTQGGARNVITGNVLRDGQTGAATFVTPMSLESSSGHSFGYACDYVISGNVWKTWRNSQALLIHAGQRIAISANTICDVMMGISANAFVAADCITDISITGNSVTGTIGDFASASGGAGIQVCGFSNGIPAINTVITGNTVRNMNMVFRDCSTGAIQTHESCGVLIAMNSVYDTCGNGIVLGPNVSAARVEGNTVLQVGTALGSQSVGVYVNGTAVEGTIARNTVRSATDGIRIASNNAPNLIVEGNILTGVTNRFVNRINAAVDDFDAIPKAIVVFDGTNASPITPSYSYNIAGANCGSAVVTKRGTGDYCVSFVRQFSCARYSMVGIVSDNSGGSTQANIVAVVGMEYNAGCCRFQVRQSGNTLSDRDVVSVTFFGQQ